MDAREAGQVRHFPVALRAARLHVVAVGLEDVGQLNLTGAPFAL